MYNIIQSSKKTDTADVTIVLPPVETWTIVLKKSILIYSINKEYFV